MGRMLKDSELIQLRECMELGLLMSTAIDNADILNTSEETIDLRMDANIYNEIMLRLSFPDIDSATEH